MLVKSHDLWIQPIGDITSSWRGSDYIHVTGYWHLEPADDWTPPAALMWFLEAGPPPVYIGFGSINGRKPEETADVVLRALMGSQAQLP
jgi:sterol 3beta-glucosyltransferase